MVRDGHGATIGKGYDIEPLNDAARGRLRLGHLVISEFWMAARGLGVWYSGVLFRELGASLWGGLLL